MAQTQMDRLKWPRRRQCLGVVILGVLSIGLLGLTNARHVKAMFPTPIQRLQSAPRPTILLIMVDTLRADHISAAGYTRPTTPNLDAWIVQPGARFTDATAVASWTSPAVASVMLGLTPTKVGVRWENYGDTALPDEAVTLIEHLHTAGYYTAGFVHQIVRPSTPQGLDHYERGFQPVGGRWDQGTAATINAAAMQWLETAWIPELSGEQPLFLFLYYCDPHTWYEPPPPYDTLYDATYTGTLTADVYQHAQRVVSGELTPTPRDVEHLIALYDGEITYWDAQLGEMLNYLDTAHLLDNALIIVTADHGEMFGENGKWVHRNEYEEALRVPLLIRYSGVISPGLVITAPVQSMDVMPTVLDLLDLPIPAGLDAVSLRPLWDTGTLMVGRNIFSEQNGITDPHNPSYWLAPRVNIRNIRQAQWKLVHHLGCIHQDRLYALQPASVYETANLIAPQAALAQRLRQDLLLHLGATFTVTGRIADVRGIPWVNVPLTTHTGLSTTTDAEGRYTFRGLAPQDYRLTPHLPGYAFAPPTRTLALPLTTRDQNFTVLAAARVFTLSPGSATQALYTDTQGLPTALTIPAGLFTPTTVLTLTPSVATGYLTYTFAGHAFTVQAAPADSLPGHAPAQTLLLSTPLSLTLHYSDRDIAGVMDEKQLTLQGRSAAGWADAAQTCVPESSYVRHLDDNVLHVSVCQLTEFVLRGPTHQLHLPLLVTPHSGCE